MSLNFVAKALAAVILEPKKIRSVTASTSLPDGTRFHDLRFLNVEFQACFFNLFHPHQVAL